MSPPHFVKIPHFKSASTLFLLKISKESKKSQKWSPDLGGSIGPIFGVIGGHSGELEHPTFFFPCKTRIFRMSEPLSRQIRVLESGILLGPRNSPPEKPKYLKIGKSDSQKKNTPQNTPKCSKKTVIWLYLDK